MSDVTAAAAAASAATAGASAAGLPPQGVLLCAAAGAVIGVWVSHADGAELSWRWAGASLGLVLAYMAFAILGTSFITAMIPSYEWLRPLGRVPEWTIAGALSLGGFWILPVLAGLLKRRAGAIGEPK